MSVRSELAGAWGKVASTWSARASQHFGDAMLDNERTVITELADRCAELEEELQASRGETAVLQVKSELSKASVLLAELEEEYAAHVRELPSRRRLAQGEVWGIAPKAPSRVRLAQGDRWSA